MNRYYQRCLESLLANSKNAKVFCLVHKMDLIQEEHRDALFADRERELLKLSHPADARCYRTSIWDETLYRAWSAIVKLLVPNVNVLDARLTQFAEILDADEVLLLEKATFLVISHCELKTHADAHRFEKVSNIIKQFKLSCSKVGAVFQAVEVRNASFACFIDAFTPNTYIMVVLSDASICGLIGRIDG